MIFGFTGNVSYQFGYPSYPQQQPYAYPPYPPAQTAVPPAYICNSRTSLVDPRTCSQGTYGTNVNIQTSEIVFVGGCPICRVSISVMYVLNCLQNLRYIIIFMNYNTHRRYVIIVSMYIQKTFQRVCDKNDILNVQVQISTRGIV